jgi:hypothetical protein
MWLLIVSIIIFLVVIGLLFFMAWPVMPQSTMATAQQQGCPCGNQCPCMGCGRRPSRCGCSRPRPRCGSPNPGCSFC